MSGVKNFLRAAAVGCIALLVACQSGPETVASADPAPPAPPAPQASPSPQATASRPEYLLDTGDKLKITVYGETELSGEFEVDGQGDISMQLIGEVRAKGMTLRDLQRSIEARFKDGQFLRDPQVSAEVMNYRPFYIRGEVRNAGEYPYISGLTVMNAIARAGDFSYRADRRRVFITSKNSAVARELPLTSDLLVQPGDTIEIKDRLF
jgi:polysaccharide export outer membrane protein